MWGGRGLAWESGCSFEFVRERWRRGKEEGLRKRRVEAGRCFAGIASHWAGRDGWEEGQPTLSGLWADSNRANLAGGMYTCVPASKDIKV